MTTPHSPLPPTRHAPSSDRRDRLAAFVRPRVILPILAVVMILAVILTPESNQSLDMRLTTYSTGPGAAQGLYDVASRLGWRTSRRLIPFREPLDTTAVYAVLGGPEVVTIGESHALLDAVRRGAGLVYVIGPGPLADSIPFRTGPGAVLAPADASDTTGCTPEPVLNTLMWLGNGVRLYELRSRRPVGGDTTVFLSVDRPRVGISLAPAVVGYSLGRGRVVVVSDPDILRNNVLRVCRTGIGPRIFAAIAYASHDGRPSLVFDEYHEGYGLHPGIVHASAVFLTSVPAGHAILQLLVGALVLLLAQAVRAIAPRGVPRIERRSPLEHVDALARAYEQITATRTTVTRLASGLRRRHDRGGWSFRAGGAAATGTANARFLAAVSASHPRIARDAARIIAAEQHSVTPEEFLGVAESVDRINAVFRQS